MKIGGLGRVTGSCVESVTDKSHRWTTAFPRVATLVVLAIVLVTSGCSRGPKRTATVASAQLKSNARMVSLLLIMYATKNGQYPPAATWKEELAAYSDGKGDTTGLEFNKALSGKAPNPKDAERTVLIYQTGADQHRSSGGTSFVIGFADGSVQSTDPSTVIWNPK